MWRRKLIVWIKKKSPFDGNRPLNALLLPRFPRKNGPIVPLTARVSKCNRHCDVSAKSKLCSFFFCFFFFLWWWQEASAISLSSLEKELLMLGFAEQQGMTPYWDIEFLSQIPGVWNDSSGNPA
jgi:hypothetical protein